MKIWLKNIITIGGGIFSSRSLCEIIIQIIKTFNYYWGGVMSWN